jgi:hypothetical protein
MISDLVKKFIINKKKIADLKVKTPIFVKKPHIAAVVDKNLTSVSKKSNIYDEKSCKGYSW